MSYINEEAKDRLLPGIHAVLNRHGLVGEVSIVTGSILHLVIQSGAVDFAAQASGDDYIDACHDREWHGRAKECTHELADAMNAGNGDHHDWLIYIDVGSIHSPYEFNARHRRTSAL